MSSTDLSILPARNDEYGTKAYWDQRYSQEGDGASFDWFKTWEDIRPLVEDVLTNKNAEILMLGCGNSKLSEEMYDDGFGNITNIDYSSVVIEQMQQQHKVPRPTMKWLEMDIRALNFPASIFDVAIDKGTMDAMMTTKGDVWDPPQQVIDDCTKEIDEVLRVLRPGGVMLYLTFGQPHFRKRYLTRPGTTLEIRKMGDAFHYYLYILRRTD